MSLLVIASRQIDMHNGFESDMVEPSSLFASVRGIVSPNGPNVTDASEMVVSGSLSEVKSPPSSHGADASDGGIDSS